MTTRAQRLKIAEAYEFAESEMARLRAALRKYGVHEGKCQAHRVIGRFGSRSGMRWNEAHDTTTCTCGLGKAIRG